MLERHRDVLSRDEQRDGAARHAENAGYLRLIRSRE
jgi:hypothetical protein